MVNVGDRVVVLHGVSRKMTLDHVTHEYTASDAVVRYFGEGTYLGDFTCIDIGVREPVAKIKMDDGKTIWGHECWFGALDELRGKFPEGQFKWVVVDIEDVRNHRRSERKINEGT